MKIPKIGQTLKAPRAGMFSRKTDGRSLMSEVNRYTLKAAANKKYIASSRDTKTQQEVACHLLLFFLP